MIPGKKVVKAAFRNIGEEKNAQIEAILYNKIVNIIAAIPLGNSENRA